MKKTSIWLVALIVICLAAASTVAISAKSATQESDIFIRKAKEEVVLYTIHRGSYDKIGPVIGNLYALAGKKGISPRGSVYYVYLNNPNQLSSQHWLTEVRIPVSKDALKAAGTLGEMTDIKTLSATDVAVAVKPQGQADPSGIYNKLYAWISKEGYITTDSAREVFLTNVMSGNYAMMKTEIIIPIQKFPPAKN
ncbi:MAG: GyrI-like domain-containing protein [Planctomycetes bacterium]|nr:GyrI-like domain-containing protein [Planctomycetota bacterium]